jgi:hypothetical protein
VPERPLDFRCACGVKCRVVVDVPASGTTVEDDVRHSDLGRVQPLPGRPPPACKIKREVSHAPDRGLQDDMLENVFRRHFTPTAPAIFAPLQPLTSNAVEAIAAVQALNWQAWSEDAALTAVGAAPRRLLNTSLRRA